MKAIGWQVSVCALVVAACSSSGSSGTRTSTVRGMVMRTNIVSDTPANGTMDSTLINAWGLAFNPTGIAWVSANGSGLSEVYDAKGNHVIPAVTIPVPVGGKPPSAPTGQVFNSDAGAFKGDKFIFVTEDGVIAGWQQTDGSQATVRVDRSAQDAIYKGVAIAESGGSGSLLFAADFHNARIDVFTGSYTPTTTAGAFRDPGLPSGFAPFNIAEVNGALIVAYAKQDADKKDDVKGDGLGYVDMFSKDGTLKKRLISGGELNAPWGIALAPKTFAAAPSRLLIGNFGDGKIHMYESSGTDEGRDAGRTSRDAGHARHDAGENPQQLRAVDAGKRREADAGKGESGGSASATLVGALMDTSGHELVIDGLWALEFIASDAGGFLSKDLYFTAGPNDEKQGVFGRLESAGAASTEDASTNGGSTGGTSGLGGATGTGGKTGFGGATGTGGKTGFGGATGFGGTTGLGGRRATGGATYRYP